MLNENYYLIRSTTEKDTYWNNVDGWVEITTATLFPRTLLAYLDLPLEGEWVIHV